MAWAMGAELANAALHLLKKTKLFCLARFTECRLCGLLQPLKLGCGFRSPEDLNTHASGSSSGASSDGKEVARAWATLLRSYRARFAPFALLDPARTGKLDSRKN